MVIKGWAVPCYPLLFGVVGIMAYLALGELSSPLLVQYVKQRPWIAWVVDLISRSTLEIYVIHQVLIGTCPGLAEIRFPLNIVVLVLVSACAATMLRYLTNPLRRWVDDVTRPAPGVA
jgi:surface polysaccharide O-acyltransferase-like enzyme